MANLKLQTVTEEENFHVTLGFSDAGLTKVRNFLQKCLQSSSEEIYLQTTLSGEEMLPSVKDLTLKKESISILLDLLSEPVIELTPIIENDIIYTAQEEVQV